MERINMKEMEERKSTEKNATTIFCERKRRRMQEKEKNEEYKMVIKEWQRKQTIINI